MFCFRGSTGRDDQQQLRIRLETDAVYLILRHIEKGFYQAAVSPVHMKEVAAIRGRGERLEIEALLRRVGIAEPFGDISKVKGRAEALYTAGFGVADAAHAAFAEQIADYFISCDDKLLKLCKRINLDVAVCSPVKFVTNKELE